MSVVAAFSRIIPRPMNLAPMMALALFGGAAFASRRAGFVSPRLSRLQRADLLGWLPSWGSSGLRRSRSTVVAVVA